MASSPLLARRQLLLLPSLGLLGCEYMPLKIQSHTNINGEETHRNYEVHNWEEFEAAMSEVAGDFAQVAGALADTTGQLIKELIDVPPAGEISLTDLANGLERFGQKKGFDFISEKKAQVAQEGSGYDFRYVQIGVPEFDDFFESAANTYALAYQNKETKHRASKLVNKLLGTDLSLESPELVKKTRHAIEGEHGHESALPFVSYLEDLDEMSGSLAGRVIERAKAVADLVTSGTRLVTSAPQQIQNPKVLLKLPLVVQGLKESVELISQSGEVLKIWA
ncbi:MAG: hypothetical protein AAGA56_08255 [Myxococcota bacterium]